MIELLTYLLGLLFGVVFGFMIWAPMTPFKEGFMDALSLKFLWGKK